MIRAPIHLRSGCEEALISIFENVQPQDYIFSYWASHHHCLLKGVPRQEVKEAILEGKSISLCFPAHRVFCSGLVGSLAGVAVGTAMQIKREARNDHVWLFTGDMSAECGIWHEAIKYATNMDLPVTFVVEDNGVSVLTPTRVTWGDTEPWYRGTKYERKIIEYRYTNGYPHSGVAVKVVF
jgi:pyruvate dehydrogenase E1 component alpha subunit